MIRKLIALIRAYRLIKKRPIGLMPATHFLKRARSDMGMLSHHCSVGQFVNTVWVDCAIDYFRRNWPDGARGNPGAKERMAKELERILSYKLSDHDKRLICLAVTG